MRLKSPSMFRESVREIGVTVRDERVFIKSKVSKYLKNVMATERSALREERDTNGERKRDPEIE